VLYLDTCIEWWPGGYTDPSLTPSHRSDYALRESALALAASGQMGPTAVPTHGANPGLVSHFVKRALSDIARDTGVGQVVPASRDEWAALAASLGVKVIHIAERDTQSADRLLRRSSRDAVASRRNWVGECTNARGRQMLADTTSDATQRSIYSVPAPRPGCAVGRRSRGHSMACWLLITSRFRSLTTSP
jgi:hypothetical protein